MRFNIDTLRSAIRPLVTIALVGAFIAFAPLDGPAFERVKDTAIMVIAYYFGTRSTK